MKNAISAISISPQNIQKPNVLSTACCAIGNNVHNSTINTRIPATP